MRDTARRTKGAKDHPRDPVPWLAVALALLAYLPFLLATQFLYPLGAHEWDFIGKWPDLGYWETQAYWYKTHTGRYSSTALLTTLPYWYHLTAFRLFALIDLLSIPIAAWWLLRAMLPGRSAILVAAMALLLYLHQLSNPYDSLLRFTCMPIYHAGLVGTLLFAGLLIRQSRASESNRFSGVLILALGAFTIGTNEISLVQLLGITTGALLICHLHARRSCVSLWVLLACLLACSVIEVFAPGNFNRAARYEGAGAILPALWQSLAVSLYLWIGWLADSLLLPAGLLWALLLASNRQTLGNTFAFGPPVYWLVGLCSITPVSLFPLLYATGGHSLAERVVDLTFFLVAILWFGTIAALFAAYRQRLQPKAGIYPRIAIPLSIFLALHLFADGLGIDRKTPRAEATFFDLIAVDANIGKGWLQLLDGTASGYAREMEKIGRDVERCRTDICRVAPLTAGDFIGYDPLYDRLGRGGDARMGKALGNPTVEWVRYRERE